MSKKQFTLDSWLKDKSQKVVTRCGFPVRIVCTDVKRKDYPILALVERDDQEEYQSFTKDGRFSLYNPLHDNFDLFIETADEVCEDEKVRKTLIDFFSKGAKLNGTTNGVADKDILAWLEKQGNDIDYANKEYWRGYREGKKEILDKYTEQSKQKPADSYCQENCKGYQETGKCFADGECKAKREAEQKPASEEDEPQKELAKSYLTKFDEKFPILPTLKGKQLADYKNFLNKCQQIFRLKYWGIRPTQAKLFEKLSLVWAAWGAEHLQGLGQTDGDMDDEISMWSEEDEEVLKQIDASLRVAENYYFSDGFREEVKSLRNWLKSLKDRVQPKQEWGEEDEQHIDSLLKRLDALCRNKFERTRFAISEDREWLKSLRPQNHWKPSELQLGCLSDAIEHYNSLGYPASKLKELLDDLKKLKEGEV